MLTLLAVWWFWITLVAVVALIICEATESPIAATITVVAGVLALQFIGGIDLWTYLKENPLNIIKMVGLYFGIGAGWCVTKWWLYALNRRDGYREQKRKFCKSYKLNDGIIPDDMKNAFRNSFHPHCLRDDYPPKVGKHKERIVRWIAYWPSSVIWTIINDFVQRIAKSIYNLISSTLQRISDKVFEKDLVE